MDQKQLSKFKLETAGPKPKLLGQSFIKGFFLAGGPAFLAHLKDLATTRMSVPNMIALTPACGEVILVLVVTIL